jgi:ribonuclease R
MSAAPSDQNSLDPTHPDYNPDDVNNIDEWDTLKAHLTRFTEEEDYLERQENPIPEKYDPEGAAMNEAEDILEGYEEEVERVRDDRVDLSENVIGIANDPEDAKDHDDAYNVFRKKDGYKAQVHIADVTHFIPKDSAIDQEIRDRGVTFYLGDNTRHMAPEKLAQNVFSLAPGNDRLALTIEMEFDRNGNRESTDVYESVVRTEHLTYPEVDSMIEDDIPEDLKDEYSEEELRSISENVSDAEELARMLREDRWGDSYLLNDKESFSSKIVEELMVEANNAVGDYLLDNKGVGVFRTEEEPDLGWTEDVAEILEGYGYNPNDISEEFHEEPAAALSEFFHMTPDSNPGVDTVEQDEEHVKEVRTDVVKKLERAEYNPSVDGDRLHFALDLLDYSQATSPIRRATDLENHRLLKGNDWRWSDLERIAERTTQQQRVAEEASRVWHDAIT